MREEAVKNEWKPGKWCMVRALDEEGVVPFRYIMADYLYGNSPDCWAACEACMGTVAFVAMPEAVRAWLAPVATQNRTHRYRGQACTTREVLTSARPARSVGELAQAIGRGVWYRRTVSEGTKGPIAYAFARRRATPGKDDWKGDRQRITG